MPGGVDPETFIGEWIDGQKAKYTARVEPSTQRDEPVSRAVKKVMEVLGCPRSASRVPTNDIERRRRRSQTYVRLGWELIDRIGLARSDTGCSRFQVDQSIKP